MSADFLSQEEVDALLRGVTGESDEPVADEAGAEGVRPYNLATQERIVRGRMPTLELINQRCARQMRGALFNFLRRGVDGRHHILRQVGGAAHPRNRARGHAPGDAQHLRAERGDEHGRRRCVGHGELHVDAIDVAVEVSRLAREQRRERSQILAHVAHGLAEVQPHHLLDDRLVAEADAQCQPAAGGSLHGQRLLRQRGGMARKGRHHRRA